MKRQRVEFPWDRYWENKEVKRSLLQQQQQFIKVFPYLYMALPI